MEYRVEDKYIVTEDIWRMIENELKAVCEPDEHGKAGGYTVRSVYFDDMYDTGLKENEAGVDKREKFRIRAYDLSDEVIHLELKSKTKGYTNKRSVELDRKEAQRLLECDDDLYLNKDADLVTKLCAEMKYRRMQPVTLVEYERIAYTYRVGNVRITFDRDIGATSDHTAMWDPNAQMIPVMPVGQHIMEVKYDELLPEYIRTILDVGNLQRTSYSKYYYARVLGHI